MLLLLPMLALPPLSLSGTPSNGVMVPPPLKSTHTEMRDPGQDATDRTVDVYAPEPVGRSSFPLISFAHGLGGGGTIEDIAYGRLLRGLAGFGYIVVAPRACDRGCRCSHGEQCSLPHDPHDFRLFYKQQQRAISWARAMATNASGVFQMLNVSAGAGVAGHSMGGQATVFSSSGTNASQMDVRAAVMLHAYTHAFPAPRVPFIAFTGTKDTTAPPSMAEGFFNAAGGSSLPRGLINRQGATHHEPDIEDYNPLLPQWVAAWFKIHLEDKPQDFGIDFHGLLFGNGSRSLCGGGGGAMAECKLLA
jgi:dienelactone hydrolase